MDNSVVIEKSSFVAVPLPVKILAVLNFIIAVGFWLSGVWFIISGNMTAHILGQIFAPAGTAGSIFFTFVGIIVILLGLLPFFIGRGLWSGKNWTRVIVIIISFLSVLETLSLIINKSLYYLIPFVIYLMIGLYFILNKSVRESFIKN